MNEEDVAIRIKGLSKTYCDFWGRPKVRALQNLDLEIKKGEVFGLIGPNGSGKTTTIKLILGLLFPTSGSISVFGYPPGSVKANERIGFLPEESYLYRFLSGPETLDFYGQLFRIRPLERKKRATELIKLVGLEHAKKRPLREYSKGMSRRIGLAQALVNDPELVILDEPTTGMDPIGRAEMKDLIRKLHQRKKTVLLCSHLLGEVEDLCDRIAILHNGILLVVGAVKDLLSVKDTTQFRVKRPSPTVQATIERLIRESEAELISVDNPTNTLEELFLRTVKESERARRE